MFDFRTVFNALIGSAMKDNEVSNSDLNPEKAEVLSDVFVEFAKVFGMGVKLKFHPEFSAASVSAEVKELDLGSESLNALREVLSDCSTLAVTPLANGCVEVSATVQKVFK